MQNKIWETYGTYESYKEADLRRKELIDTHELVKIKRCGKGGNQYKIKYWNSPPVETKQKKAKKGKKQ